MRVSLIFCMVEEDKTNFLRSCDLFEDGKYLVEFHEVSYDTASQINKAYFTNILSKAKEMKFNLGAIIHEGEVYKQAEVKTISDGHNFFYLG